jgi:hypothetical protein
MRCFAPIVASFVAASVTAGPVQAQTQHHSEFHADTYRHWKQPGSGTSCCNARTSKDGHEEGDCEPTRAELRAGRWFAWVPLQGRWVEIPESRILRERNPSPFDAHLCFAFDEVICFVPPDTGS